MKSSPGIVTLVNDLISGKLVFVTSVDDEESPNKLRSETGTFTATRILK